MKRDITKVVEEYRNKFEDSAKSRFTLSDITGIRDMSTDYADMIINATYAGYVIGYKAAKKGMASRSLKEGRC